MQRYVAGVERVIAASELRNVVISSHVDWLSDDIILELGTIIQKETTSVTDVPKDWKEALKLRFLPKYLLKRYPVKYLEVDTEVQYKIGEGTPKMSEMKHYIGVLREVERMEDEGLEEQCKRVLGEQGSEPLSNYYDSYTDLLEEEHYEDLVVLDSKLYRIEKEEVEHRDSFTAVRGTDGKIAFSVRYYDGGCSLEEALEDAMRNLEKGESK